MHGQGADKYDNVRIGLTGRLDTIQAAVLLEKLKIFPDEIVARNAVAQRYCRGLGDVAIVPRVPDGYTSVWAQYTIRLKPGDARRASPPRSRRDGIPTAIYYPKPLHRQTAYQQLPVADGGLPVSDQLADEVISLPMHAYLDEPTQDRIIDAVRRRWPVAAHAVDFTHPDELVGGRSVPGGVPRPNFSVGLLKAAPCLWGEGSAMLAPMLSRILTSAV